MEKFALQRFHGVIIDDHDRPAAASLLNQLQTHGNAKKSIVIALADKDAVLDAVFEAGTHLAIYKPLTHDKLRNGLRAIRPLMGKQQHRVAPRVKVNISATLTVNKIESIPVKLLDLSTAGAALSVASTYPAIKSLQLCFALPGEDATCTPAELVWKNV